MSFLKRQVEQALAARQRNNEPRRKLLRGIITQIDGSVSADVPQLIYVRGVEENGSIRTLLNDGVIAEPELGMLVWYEPSPNTEVSRWQLVKFDAAFYLNDRATYETLPTSGLPAHGDSHFYPPGRIPRDPTWVSSHQIVDLLVIPTDPASMRVQVLGGWYAGATNWDHLAGPLLSEDMTARIPATAGQARVVAITLDNTGALTYYNGAAFSDGIPMPPTAWPTVPISETLLTGVTLVNGMTAISSDAFNKEMRAVVTGGGGGSTVPATETEAGIAEIATQTETDTGTDDERIVTPLKLANATTVVHPARTISTTAPLSGGGDLSANRTLSVGAASESASGVAEIATQAEVNAGTDDLRIVTPLKMETRLATVSGLVYQVYDSTLTNVVIEADAAGNVVFNDSGADRDWRMASSINTYGFFLRGSDGAVGIGTSTPTGILHTVGSAVTVLPNWTNEAYGAAASVVGVRANGTIASPTTVVDADNIWTWAGYGFDGSVSRLAAEIRFEVDSPSGSDIPADIVFRTHALGDSTGITTERMWLLSTGALMVGGSTQQTSGSKLELHRAGEVYLSLYNSGDTTAERGGYISWYTSGPNLGARIGAYRESGNSTGASMVFLTQPVGGSLTSRMYITPDGNVGIGTDSNPPEMLTVNLSQNGNTRARVRNASTGTAATAGFYLTAYNGSAESGAIFQMYGANNTATLLGGAVNAAKVFSIRVDSSQGNMALITGASGSSIYFGTLDVKRVTITTGVQIGTPTGGDKGTGWINLAAGIALNNTNYTNPDYSLSHYFEGSVEKFKDNPGADKYGGLVPLDQLRDYLRTNLHLPNRWESSNLFEWADMAQMWCEELAIYITELHERLERLEAKHGNT